MKLGERTNDEIGLGPLHWFPVASGRTAARVRSEPFINLSHEQPPLSFICGLVLAHFLLLFMGKGEKETITQLQSRVPQVMCEEKITPPFVSIFTVLSLFIYRGKYNICNVLLFCLKEVSDFLFSVLERSQFKSKLARETRYLWILFVFVQST